MFITLYVKAPQIYAGNSQTIPRLLFQNMALALHTFPFILTSQASVLTSGNRCDSMLGTQLLAQQGTTHSSTPNSPLNICNR